MLLRWKRVLHRRRRQAVTTVQVPETVSKALDTVQVPKIVSKAPLDTFQATRPQDQKANQVSPVAEAIVAPSQVESATTLAPDKFKMAVLSPSNISTSKTVSLGNHEALNFPSAPGLAAKRKYERRKAEWEADLKAELDKLDELHTAMGSLEDPLHRPLIAEDQAAVKTKFQSILKSYLQEIGEITCPYCLYALPAEEVFDERRWQNHVKNDLDPYVCLFEDCDKPDELYTHSEGWLSHLHQHGQHWLCSSHRQLGRLRTREEYIQHLRETHGANLSDAQLHALASRSARKTVNLFPSCPLCGQDETNVEGRLEDHITGHLRSLALKSLPSYQDDMPDGDGSGRDIDSSAPRSRSTVKNMGEEEDSVAFRTEGFWDHWNPPLREINPTNFLGEPHIELSPTQIISWDLGPLLSQDLFGSLEDDPILQTMVQRSKGKNKKVKVSARKEGKQPSIAKIAEWVEAITDAQVKNQIQVDRKVDSVQEGMARLERNARENPDAEFVREATIRETTDVETSGERLEEDVPGKESEDTAATVRAPEQKDKDVTVSKVKVQQETTDRIAAEGTKKPEIATIKFKDAVGRKFTFPLHICRTWSEMENLIHQAFMGINVLGPRVQAGEFDLLGPNGEIILPQDWEKVVQPGWYIIMVMRPTEELDLAPPPPYNPVSPPPPKRPGRARPFLNWMTGYKVKGGAKRGEQEGEVAAAAAAAATEDGKGGGES
ncbi:uncharacterized protein DNG_02417 [Cephalotrichum gorgonifer]|uniref:Ubiquitin-like domain-containing protein n=1 Tax=Cephalotrichum gorgonifer TaxID=2041049 RepID=A0AAE8MUE6_9PEZI|nr:uncharacterized protein DNG_02417 [Cephalotrichum gorgonifer]